MEMVFLGAGAGAGLLGRRQEEEPARQNMQLSRDRDHD